MTRTHGLIAGAAFVLMTSGCVSVLPEPVVPEGLYRMNPGSAPVSARLPARGSVLLSEPEGSSLLLGKQIAVESSDGTLSVLKSAQWSDPAARLFLDLMLDTFAASAQSGEGDAVASYTGAYVPYELKLRVKDFAVSATSARAAFSATLLDARTRDVIEQFDIAAVEQTALSGSNGQKVRALATAASDAASQIAERTSQEISDHLASKQESEQEEVSGVVADDSGLEE